MGRIVVHALVLAWLNIVASRLGYALFASSSMEDPLVVVLPVALIGTVVGFALWAQWRSDSGRRSRWATGPRLRSLAIWALSIAFAPLLARGLGSLLRTELYVSYLFQIPANALALGAAGLLSRPAPAAPVHLFVYGLLRSDANEHHRLQGRARCLGEAWVPGRVYEAGGYPVAVPSTEEEDRVWGELYALSDGVQLLGELDRFEGAEGASREFVRALADVHVANGSVKKAWTYYYARSVDELPRIDDGRWVIAPGAGR